MEDRHISKREMCRADRIVLQAPGIHSSYRHGNFRNTDSRDAAAAGRNGSRFRAAGFDRRTASSVGDLRIKSGRSAFLSRALVTVLPPPVGGISRTRGGNSRGGREADCHFSGQPGKIAGGARRAAIALHNFVRHAAYGGARVGRLQSARKRRHRETGGVHN